MGDKRSRDARPRKERADDGMVTTPDDITPKHVPSTDYKPFERHPYGTAFVAATTFKIGDEVLARESKGIEPKTQLKFEDSTSAGSIRVTLTPDAANIQFKVSNYNGLRRLLHPTSPPAPILALEAPRASSARPPPIVKLSSSSDHKSERKLLTSSAPPPPSRPLKTKTIATSVSVSDLAPAAPAPKFDDDLPEKEWY